MTKKFASKLILALLLGTTAATGMATPSSPPHPLAATDERATPEFVSVTGISLLNPTTAEVWLSNGHRLTVDFYGDNIFRLFRDDQGGIVRNPKATPPADILVKNPRRPVGSVTINDSDPNRVTAATDAVEVSFDRRNASMTVKDLRNGRTVIKQTTPTTFEKGKTRMTLEARPGEYFYGGGVQNGRFSHRGRAIAIENQNSWTDGGVASPAPFYWSTDGYGVMFHTFAKGKYDFGATDPNCVNLMHETPYLDMFVMVDETPVALLNDFYQLTGNPVLLPKFGFYEGHLNAYNRDYWTEDSVKGILFEDGKRYRESQQNNGGIRESLNGENDNYQFSARAVVDRYASHDMPLGWILPNDGYGAGYGQTSSLDGNIENLKSFGEYARDHGVEIGLWTQSDLHPKEGIAPLLQRDIVKEVRDAGVRVLKTDVAWVGAGYSFGLNGVADVGEIMPYYGKDARPFIISLDGWAGTQRYAGIWSGDQTGGNWEYIRFHIPTYIGSGLSGQPNISSDMDGIFGGKNPVVNTRDFQWKTFSPMQLNMDGWGQNEKYPHALGEPATSINRNYLKFKSELMPYAYTYAREAVDGKPLIRAMFVDYPNAFTYGPATAYQFLYGPSFLVAPIYQNTAADSLGNDLRHNIYLPKGGWIDYFTGDRYEGEVVLNSFDAPLWKLPLFVKEGSIIPLVNPNNNPGEINRKLRIYDIYPAQGEMTEMTEYDDDGTTQAYLQPGNSATTRISTKFTPKGVLNVTIDPTKGSFKGFEPVKATELLINGISDPTSIKAIAGGRKFKLQRASSVEELDKLSEGYYYDTKPEFNRFATRGSEFAAVSITRAPRLMVKLAPINTTVNGISIDVAGVKLNSGNKLTANHGSLTAPAASVTADNTGAYTLTPSWNAVDNADYYDILFNDLLYTNIRPTEFTFDGLTPEREYEFKIRAVNADGTSDWATFTAQTKSDPLEWAIRGLRGECSAESQPGFYTKRLFDFAESGDMFHTRYRKNAIPFDLIIDLQSVNTLDKLQYLPPTNAGNGTFLRGNVSVSLDKENWTPVDSFTWLRNSDTKEFIFNEHPTARYVKLTVVEGVNNYGAGREIYVFKVPGTESYIPGDINADGKIDMNDLTSYMNYTGLRQGDPDFEGYVSNGDINGNGLIDAYDISVVATRLDDGVEPNDRAKPLAGSISLSIDAPTAVGDTAVVTVKGVDLQSVNAISAAIAYDPTVWEYITVEPLATAGMENLTRDRLHADGHQAVYPTFVNIGEKADITGSEELFKISFRRLKKSSAANFKLTDTMLVDKKLTTLKP